MKRAMGFALPWTVWALSVSVAAAGAIFYLQNPHHFGDSIFSLMLGWTFPTVGAMVASRRPENPIGWIFLTIGVCGAVQIFGVEYGTYGLITDPGAVPFAGAAVVAASWTIGLSFGLFITFALLLFPTGHLPSPRWRFVAWASAAGIGLMTLGLGLHATRVGGRELLGQLGAEGVQAEGVAGLLNEAGHILVFLGLAAAVLSLFVRRRRASREERQQLKWFAMGASIVGLAIGMSFAVREPVGLILEVVGTASIPVAVGIAILKHRLYDIDVVINKTLVYGALAAFITAVYVTIVVGLGLAIGTRGEANLGLQIAATALVAVLFQPVRQRVQHLANRLVYGERATPYEVMAGFGDRMAGSLRVEQVLPQMAEAAARGVGAAAGRVHVALPDGAHREARWPAEGPVHGDERTLPVIHRGERIGEIAVTKAPGDPLRPQEEVLLRDLATQAGLALHNVRLAEELRARIQQISGLAEELGTSRRRILSAADDERRRLERTIEDRVERRIEEMRGSLRRLSSLLDADPDAAEEAMDAVGAEARATLEELRDIARGIFPPLLADRGLTAALEAQERKITVPVTVEADGVGRYPEEVEAGVYFCCLEALQNADRHAEASRIEVHLAHGDGGLVFEVADDGRGFDPGKTPAGPGLQTMRDRIEALDGTLEVRSAPGDGTTIAGRIPVVEREPVG